MIIYDIMLLLTLSFIIDVCIDEFVVLDSANTEHTIKCLNTFNFIKDIFNSLLKIIQYILI